ncbi:MAG: MaoC/PaaZ C-terminal domain-containing protein [Acidimicrobiales bacterium]
MPGEVVTTKTAIHDPPESYEANPIHSAQGAAAAGYAGALVAGIHTYGWAANAVIELFGEEWLALGWADVRYRRPVYPGELLTTTVTEIGEAAARLVTTKAGGEVVLEGQCGLGIGPFTADLEQPERVEPAPEPPERVRMLLAEAPVGQDFLPMAVDASASFLQAWVETRLDEHHPRWLGDRPLIHPAFLAGRMTPLFRHNYLYGPAIHVRTQIQHLRAGYGPQRLAVAARLHAAYERKGHHYHESDCWILGEDGEPIAAKRHTGIFLVGPRG